MTGEATLIAALRFMLEKKIRHLAVVQNDKVIGVVSMGDVVKEIVRQQDLEIGQLENYIFGTR